MDSAANKAKIAILGAGTWGSTLAWLFSSAGKQVSIWSRDEKRLKDWQGLKTAEGAEVSMPKSVVATQDLSACVSDAEIVIFCCTAQSMRSVGQKVAQALATRVKAGARGPAEHTNAILVSAAKGIELNTFCRMTDILKEVVPAAPVCALSGPNLAAEVLSGLPTASVVACHDENVARFVQQQLSVPAFRVYTNTDVVGVELGGALKNIVAIAAGAVDGLKLGTNAKAALMTRGLAEMTRLSSAMGAKPSTMWGLAGMGDLAATCYSSLSRNYRIGYRMALGDTSETAETNLGAVAEGITTTRAVCALSKRLDIPMPIAEQVDATLSGTTTPERAIMTLMSRPLASE